MTEKKNRVISLKLRALAAVLLILVFIATPLEVQVDNLTTCVSVGRTEVSAADSITVKSANDSTVKKIHEKLAKGKAVTLKVKGNEAASKKLLKTINNKIKKVNKQGVIFEYTKGKTSGGYTYYSVSNDQAGTYMYAVKFIEKLYKLLKESYNNDESRIKYINDMKLYPDEDMRKLHWVYDYIVDNEYRNGVSISEHEYVEVDEGTYDEKTTTGDVYIEDFRWDDYELTSQLVKETIYTFRISIYQYINGQEILVKTWEYDSSTIIDGEEGSALIEQVEQEVDNMGIDGYTLCTDLRRHAAGYTFDEFCKLPVAQKLVKRLCCFLEIKDADMTIYNTENFCDLSDAMKVYAIDASKYFACYFSRPKYGMVYDYTWERFYGKKGMKTLYQNKAIGVCEVFAAYENQVWTALGIENYNCANYDISHAWTVVKVKNSKGKVLWIPYDYGIGPAEGLAVSEEVRNKYLKTEAMRYKLYLAGIKGAPKKKNFTNSDFN